MCTQDQQNRGSEASYWDTIQDRQLGTIPSCGGEHPPGVTPGQSVYSVVSADSALTSIQQAGHKDQVYSCDQCGHEANVTVDLKKHKAEVHNNSAYTCNQCGLEDAGTASLKKHKKQTYKDSAYSSGQCQAEANSTDEEEQQEEQEEQDEEEEEGLDVREEERLTFVN